MKTKNLKNAKTRKSTNPRNSTRRAPRPKWTRQMIEDLANENDVTISVLEPFEVYGKGIIGYDINTFGLVYDIDKLIAAIANDFLKHPIGDNAKNYTYNDAVEDAIEWIEYNTIRSIPYMPGAKPILIHTGSDM